MNIQPVEVNGHSRERCLGNLAGFIVALLSAIGMPPIAWSQDLYWLGQTPPENLTPTAAGSGSWALSPAGSSTFSGPADWLASPVPTSTPFPTEWVNGGAAHFIGSPGGTVTLGSAITAASITFDHPAGIFTINTNGNVLTIQGTGIANNSGNTQAIINNGTATPPSVTLSETLSYSPTPAPSATPIPSGNTQFLNAATAGNVRITNNGGAVSGAQGGSTLFAGSSNAGSATIITSGGAVSGAGGGLTQFGESSNAANASITNGSRTVVSTSPTAYGGTTQFYNTATAGSATIVNAGSAVSDPGFGGFTGFNDASTAGSAKITAQGGTVNGGGGGTTQFHDKSTAANATLAADGSTVSGARGGSTVFTGSSTAGSATITAGGAVSAVIGGGLTQFQDSSNAANARITAAGGAASGAQGGITLFLGTSSAGSATITNNGGAVVSAQGGFTQFSNSSTAGSATIVTNGGTNGGLGGQTVFFDSSDGGTARAITNGNGRFDISGLTVAAMRIGSIEGDGNYFLGSKTLSVGGNNSSTTVSGVVQDGGFSGGAGGSLAKDGTGTLTLMGTNTYTGGTTISAGTLALAGAGRLVSTGAVVISNGGTFDISQSANDQTIGDLSGAGTVKLGARELTVGTANNATFAGTITDGGLGGGTGGSLVKQGAGTLTLTGTSTYTGGTTINAGTLQLGNGGPTGSIVGDVVDNGTLAFNHSNSFTFGGIIRGSGGVTQAGPGTTILTGDSTYTGGTSIAPGSTLQLGNGGTTGSVAGPIADNGTLAVNRSADLLVASVISGAGDFQQNGPGTTTLTAQNTYTGATTVNAGRLIVDGSIGPIGSPLSTVTVNPGGLLGGSGTIRGNVVNSGIVSPGDPVGRLTVTGNYTQTSGGTLRINVAPNASSLLAVNGQASLGGGTLQLVPTGGFSLRPGQQVTVLTAAGGVTGTFAPLQNPFIGNTIVEANVVTLATSVLFEGAQGSFTDIVTRLGPTPNRLSVAHAVDSAVGDPRAAGLIAYLDSQPLNQILHDMDLIAPDEVTSTQTMGAEVGNVQTSNVGQRLETVRAGSTGFSSAGFALNGQAPTLSAGLAGVTGPEGKSGPSAMAPIPQNRWGVFITGLGEFTNVGSTYNAAGFDVRTAGVTLGADYRLAPYLIVGLTAGYAHTWTDLADGGSLDTDGGIFGAYASLFGHGFYLDAAVMGGPTGYDSRRATLQGTARGSTDGTDFNVMVAGGYDWKVGGLSVGPTARFQYSSTYVDGFTEHGSLAPLRINDQHAESKRTDFGVKATYDWKVGAITIKPEVRAAWQHEYGTTEYAVVSAFANGAGNPFNVSGPAVGHDSLLIGAGAAVLWSDRLATYIYYDGELGRANYEAHAVSAGVRVTF